MMMKTFLLLLNLILNVFAQLQPKAVIETNMLKVKTNQGIHAINKNMILEKRIFVDEMLTKTKLDDKATLQRAWFTFQRGHLSAFQLYSDGNCEAMDWRPIMSHLKKEAIGEYSKGIASLNYKVAGNQCRDHKYVGLPGSMGEVVSWFRNGFESQKTTEEQADVIKWTNLDQKALNHTVTRREMYRTFLDEAYRFKHEQKYMCYHFGSSVAEFLTGRKPLSANMFALVARMAETV